MSLKPPKKSDLNKEWMQKRASRNIMIQPEFHLIVTEGEKTEPNYFNCIKEKINSEYADKINLQVHGTGKNTLSLLESAVELANENPNGYRHVWVVYDTDSFPAEDINKVVEWCKINSTDDLEYHAIWSNQCIELWYLLHFSFFHSNLHRSEYFPKLSECLKSIKKGEYKKNREDMFGVLMPYVDAAISNAKKLEEVNAGKTPAESAPGTKVYILVEHLLPYLR